MNPSPENEDIVRQYFDRIFRRDPSVYDLYAEDALFVMPTGERIEGREVIRAHIDARFQNTPHLDPVTLLAVLSAGSTVAVVLEATFDEGVFKGVDVFELEDGKIQVLSIYHQA
ncbi:nuclear transport factor 2 family protein [Nocardioides immobilis]|uniref:Nuclear transport factor 2 family protein n=1 Tax=Nocardioides immobilis TaxID=2049295 RepID=A0A417Y0T8_9ACTN|nr:nuclear transport factor 2 family protein [Nocardioides immobilis]RHW26272.1 nuclear transport factor 2 family protein [Nocardioides immobilis]